MIKIYLKIGYKTKKYIIKKFHEIEQVNEYLLSIGGKKIGCN